jgi:hypothetical protein
MVLLFWALFTSQASASSINFVRCDKDDVCAYTPPPIEEGPVIDQLRKHYCTGRSHPLILSRAEVYTPALVEEMRVRAEYRADGAIWVGAQSTWNDDTIFADMPYNYDLWMKTGMFMGIMDKHMAKLLDVSCANGKEPAPFYVTAVD